MQKTELIKRYGMLLAGLLIMAYGVAFSICGDLGTSPISSLPYVVSEITVLSVGTATILMHCVFVLLQIVILRRNYQPIQLLQLAAAVAFGRLTDLAVWMTSGIVCQNYLEQWLACIAGILLVGIGVALEVQAGVITIAGEGLVLALAQVLPIRFASLKILFDVTLVVLASVLSVVFLHELCGVREGTLAAALFVGMTAKVVGKPLRAWSEHWFRTAAAAH